MRPAPRAAKCQRWLAAGGGQGTARPTTVKYAGQVPRYARVLDAARLVLVLVLDRAPFLGAAAAARSSW